MSEPTTADRFVCTAETPWQPQMARSIHPDAAVVGLGRDGYPGGDLQDYKCPHCGLFFTVEIGQ